MNTNRTVSILLAAVCGLSACSSQKNPQIKPPEAVQQPVKRQPQVSPLRRKVLSLLEKKQYRQAVESMRGRYHEGLEKEYLLAINKLLEVGDDSYALGDYVPAAQAYKCVLNAYPPEPSLRERISHNAKQIRVNMDTCLGRMMEQGLTEYRSGRLENAIRKWKELLAISPGNHEAKQALETATTQLQSLQRLQKGQ